MNPEKFLNSLVNYEKIQGYDYNLQNYEKFLTKVESPQRHLKNVIHIGGTNGKGSTAAIINSCLITHGYKVGLYTSPHLNSVYERISVSNTNISKTALAQYIKLIRPHVKQTKGIRTYFEVLTTVAFLYFIKEKTDFSILEVGLGGRLDATNITNPLISIITKVGYDHTLLLGYRLAQIASEKAGIIKKGLRLITIHQRPSAENIIKKIARQKTAPLLFAEESHSIKVLHESLKGTSVKITGELGEFKVFLPLVGRHQLQNLALALAVLNELKKQGFTINLRALKKGIKNTVLHGRFEVLSKKPLLIYDCAHNDDSFEAFMNNIKLLKTKKISLIFGCKKNKDIRYCLKNIFPRAQEVVLVKAHDPPGMEPTDIYKKAKRYQKNLTIASSVKDAIDYLKTKNSNNTAIIITGTFYLWNEIFD